MSWSSFFASGRNVTSYSAGIATGLSIAAAFHLMDASKVDAVLDHIGQLSVSITGLGGILTTVYTVLRSWRSASPEHQQASVAARPDRMVLEIDPKNSKMAAIAAASIPEIKTVVTSQVVADAIPLDKVVGPDQAIEVTK